VRLAKIRPTLPWRAGSVRGEGWNCEVCGLKPYRHDGHHPHAGHRKGCAAYRNAAARRILGWW
jgi:hypothetical protein